MMVSDTAMLSAPRRRRRSGGNQEWMIVGDGGWMSKWMESEEWKIVRKGSRGTVERSMDERGKKRTGWDEISFGYMN